MSKIKIQCVKTEGEETSYEYIIQFSDDMRDIVDKKLREVLQIPFLTRFETEVNGNIVYKLTIDEAQYNWLHKGLTDYRLSQLPTFSDN
jgi:hypothetical protein